MFRAAVFSLLLALTAGPGASLLSRICCAPQEVANAGCGHEDPVSPRLAACGHAISPGASFLPEEARRGLSSSQHGQVISVVRIAGSTPDARPGNERARALAVHHPPPSAQLRI